jgi:hypothetical protein
LILNCSQHNIVKRKKRRIKKTVDIRGVKTAIRLAKERKSEIERLEKLFNINGVDFSSPHSKVVEYQKALNDKDGQIKTTLVMLGNDAVLNIAAVLCIGRDYLTNADTASFDEYYDKFRPYHLFDLIGIITDTTLLPHWSEYLEAGMKVLEDK